ncbi:aldehyde-activating protein [Endozoicomonas sp. OPT23]|uniref:GFA family protein n=1 Tax=Endozoicomonas sp. OPT23 TaxID=2072845 RepID=UPI00129B4817|nr:GFA family protein [Endozoicomonas sp. OPT23]MRI34230.1 aldehyde-activating protein [Endozoicomonas sp. OPT23]
MADYESAQGQCLCGAVKVTCPEMSLNVGACHCTMCQQWTGGPFMAVECGSNVSFEGKDAITTYSSSDWADRGFCSHCGTHLFYRFKHSDQYMMPAGLFGDSHEFNFTQQIFIDEKPNYFCFANDIKAMTGAEVVAIFAGESESN